MNKQRICIFNKAISRASNYGIGTYIYSLLQVLHDLKCEFIIVNLYASGNEVDINHKKGYIEISIPFPSTNNKNVNKYYSRNVAYLLKEILSEENKSEYIFQLNFMDNNIIVKHLKKIFKCKILTVVHYTNWSFEFFGDIDKVRKLYNINSKESKTSIGKAIMKSVKNDLNMLEQSDRVVFVARHTYKSFQDLGLKQRNIEIINNSINDSYKSISEENKLRLRQKFFIGQLEKIIIFAGRLDMVKGVEFLITAFKRILVDHPEARLFIAGDGNFTELMKHAASCWSKISFTGHLEKKALHELYSISDIGIVCSLHEEFGYVAIEMMMYALPVIVTKTSGLDEIVEDGVSGLKVPIVKRNGIRIVDIKKLTEKILLLIENPKQAKVFGENARERFLEKYELSLFKRKIFELYTKINHHDTTNNSSGLGR